MSLSRKTLFTASLLSFFFASAAPARAADASFSLSPSTGVCIPRGSFDLNIVLRADEPTSGATAILNYDPSILEASSLTSGDIFPQELINSIDSSEGRIRLDAGVNVANPDFFSGEGTFGIIRFRVLEVGDTGVSFDFTAGSTTDSNVAHAETHQDILTSASGGTYTFQEDNDGPSLDPSCVSGEGSTPTPTPTPTPSPSPSPSPSPTPTPPPGGVEPTPTSTLYAPGRPTPPPASAAPPTDGGTQAPAVGTLEPTVFISLLSLLMIGIGLILK